MLVLDDLHWASKPVLLLLRHVLRAAVAEEEGVRLLVLATYRDTELGRNHALAGVMADVRRLSGVEQFTMVGLSVAEVTEFVSQTSGHDLDEDSRRLAEILHVETEGNPFFVEELLRHLVETGTVHRRGNRWVVADAGTRAVPEGVRDVVGQRLDACRRRPTRRCRWRPCSAATSTSSCSPTCGKSLRTVCWMRWMRRWGQDLSRRPAPTTIGSPMLVRATLVEELSATRRRRLHCRVGETLEKLRPEDVVALAYHFSQAGPDRGARSRAVRTAWPPPNRHFKLAPWATETRFRQVLGLLDDPATLHAPARIAALCGLGEAQRDQGNPEFRTTLLEAGRLAQASGDVPLLVQAALANSRGCPA